MDNSEGLLELPLRCPTGELSTLWDPVKVPLKIGGLDIEFPMLVADLTDQRLLGLDFLAKVDGDVFVTKHCSEDQTDWDEHLPLQLMAYRSAAHEATGCTPVQRMCGREMRLPMDLAMGRPPDEEELPEHRPAYVRELRRRMEVHWFARQKLKLAGEALRRRHHRGARDVSFQLGDRVWLQSRRRKRGLSPKLQ